MRPSRFLLASVSLVWVCGLGVDFQGVMRRIPSSTISKCAIAYLKIKKEEIGFMYSVTMLEEVTLESPLYGFL